MHDMRALTKKEKIEAKKRDIKYHTAYAREHYSRINLSFSNAYYAEICEIAQTYGLTAPEYVKKCIAQSIEQYKKAHPGPTEPEQLRLDL